MRSKAHFKTHPLHPMLIPFPLAFFIGTFIFHAAGFFARSEGLMTTAYYLNIGGIIGAVLAAVPGIIDYLHTVPPQSSAKKRAAQHGVINTMVLLLFTAILFYRQNADANQFIILAAELLGVVLLAISGWMGGTLVYRNQIGVDQRYANAGKWNEAYFDADGGLIAVASMDELKVNTMKLLHVNGKRIVLARTEDRHVAFDDRCTHKGGSLAGGSMMCGVVQCPWHGSQFSTDTGAMMAGPAKEGIKTYVVVEKDGKVFISL